MQQTLTKKFNTKLRGWSQAIILGKKKKKKRMEAIRWYCFAQTWIRVVV